MDAIGQMNMGIRSLNLKDWGLDGGSEGGVKGKCW